jgi:Extracellular link domain
MGNDSNTPIYNGLGGSVGNLGLSSGSSSATSSSTSNSTSGTSVNTASVVNFIVWGLAIYFAFRFTMSIFSRSNSNVESAALLAYSRAIDFALLGGLLLLAVYGYYSLAPSDQNNILGFMLNWTYEFFNDPNSLLECILFTVVFFVLVYLLQVPMAKELRPFTVHLIEHKIWILYLMFVIIYFFKYILGILFNNQLMYWLENVSNPSSSPNSSASPSTTPTTTASPGLFQGLINWITNTTIPPTTSSPTSTSGASSNPSSSASPNTNLAVNLSQPVQDPCGNKLEVYNIGSNTYTYKEAQSVCKSFNATLANYDQIERAYQDGGEWCNYGWSEGQMAYFPTQKKTWDGLQQNPSTKHSCGRPGINGGFISNPNVKFGVNCYGVKPGQPSGWNPGIQMPAASSTPTPTSMDPALVALRNNASKYLNAFSQPNGQWSEYYGKQKNTSSVPATSVPATSVPATSVPATSVPANDSSS